MHQARDEMDCFTSFAMTGRDHPITKSVKIKKLCKGLILLVKVRFSPVAKIHFSDKTDPYLRREDKF